MKALQPTLVVNEALMRRVWMGESKINFFRCIPPGSLFLASILLPVSPPIWLQ